MEFVDDIRRLGFRRWYERQLIECHAYFVTVFVCMILVLAVLEAANLREPSLKALLMVAIACAGGATGVFSWHRYKVVLDRAEHIGERAACPQCDAYGAFRIGAFGPREVDPEAEPDGSPPPGFWMRVRCKKCAHEWVID